jgi:hypothetical protein
MGKCIQVRWLPILLIFGMILPMAHAATPQQIDKAIAKAQNCLIAQELAGGHWEPDDQRIGFFPQGRPMQGHTWGGYTALATYALLASGMSPKDPHIVDAVGFLKKADIVGIYAVSMRLQVWLLMYENTKDRVYRTLAQKDARFLLEATDATGPLAGLWGYVSKDVPLPAGGRRKIDHSASQMGVLGLWAAAQMGVEIPQGYWELCDRVWKQDQFPDGGWAYASRPGDGAQGPIAAIRPSMTAAGIATLFITEQYIHGNNGNCLGNISSPSIDRGLSWITQHFDEADDPYTFFDIERIGVASGYKYFGTTDWFATIADKLVIAQSRDGAWGPFNGLSKYNDGGNSPCVSTSFALLFLSRGGAPVMMNKLDYSVADAEEKRSGNWNERPRDVFNLASWAGPQAESDLNWQIVNLRVDPDDWHDAPILYLSGNKALAFSDADREKLRQFIEGGGLILGNADCNSVAFKESFMQLGQKLFPAYQFRQLPHLHPILANESFHKFRSDPDIMGLSNGVRELMLLLPTGDPGRFWQDNFTISDHGLASFQLGFDIWLYSVDKLGLRKKGDNYIVHPDDGQTNQTIKIGRLMIGDNPDPEPGGWKRLSAILHNDPFRVELDVSPAKPGDDLSGYQIVHLTGTTAFTLTADQRKQLLEFTSHGGTLIIDAAGGSGPFAQSAEAELKNLYGKDAESALAHPLRPDSPVFNLPNVPLDAINYREYAKKLLGDSTKPRICEVIVKGRIVAFFSREDLSAGLVGEQVDGIVGYTPRSATELMRNLILYSTEQEAGR